MMNDYEVGQCPVVHPTWKIKLKMKVSITGTDKWKIRFNASLASCVSIESTHAQLLV